MALSISANNGNGLANLFRQGRPVKTGGDATPAASEPSTVVSLRPIGRSGIDSTGSGTAQISAALTVYLSALGGSDDVAQSSVQATSAAPTSGGSRSSAGDLLRTLDDFRTPATRLRA